jgi:serine/threonine protein kinase
MATEAGLHFWAATPAQMLEGEELEGGWRVGRMVANRRSSTGGTFSECYEVTGPDGRKGFLKALDYSRALAADDPALALEAMTAAYNFERELLRRCARLDRIVTAITSGRHVVPGAANGQVVQYLIFEMAEGDVRQYSVLLGKLSLAWVMRALHHVTTGIEQLHSQRIAHQDIKPSNILVYAGNNSRVADLGRAAARDLVPPHDSDRFPGDPHYAPPELHYNYLDPDWRVRRMGADLYLLGSMVTYFFTGSNMTALLAAELPPELHWERSGLSFDDALPEIKAAFGRVLVRVENEVPEVVRADIIGVIRELCEPDPRRRGHPQSRRVKGDEYSVRRYVALFDSLARRATAGVARSILL